MVHPLSFLMNHGSNIYISFEKTRSFLPALLARYLVSDSFVDTIDPHYLSHHFACTK